MLLLFPTPPSPVKKRNPVGCARESKDCCDFIMRNNFGFSYPQHFAGAFLAMTSRLVMYSPGVAPAGSVARIFW
jgi:hypothetical protein